MLIAADTGDRCRTGAMNLPPHILEERNEMASLTPHPEVW
jgi:hypothetical protein